MQAATDAPSLDDDHRRGSVLIVDDSTDTRLIARMILESAGYTTVEAADGAVALGLLERGERPDVVLLDLRMPNVDGYAVLDRLAHSPEYRHVPVVVFTSHVGDVDRDRFTADGRPPVVTKPFLPDKLVGIVDRAAHVGRDPVRVVEGSVRRSSP